jgi:hypothetical protein
MICLGLIRHHHLPQNAKVIYASTSALKSFLDQIRKVEASEGLI